MHAPEPPHNLDDERAVLSSIIRNREAIVPIAPWLDAGHFYYEKHGMIYAAMLACFNARTSPNITNVAAELRKAERMDAVGMDVLMGLTDGFVSSYDVESYARRVIDYAAFRRLITAGGKIAALGYDYATGIDNALSDATRLLSGIQVASADDVLQPVSVAVDAYYDKMDRVTKGEISALGVQTGYRDLDEITVGLHPDELTVIAARPAIGKTAFMLSLSYNIAKRSDVDILLFSLEMSRDPLLIRLVAMDTRIDSHRLRIFHLNEAEQKLVIESLSRVSQLPIFIADISAMTADQIRLETIRHMSKRGRPCVPMVDYLQLMGSTRRHENRVQDVSEISRSLKNMARELHVPVIALSQLSRAVESRQSHIPMLSDLRESGTIEQDSDNVWFIYREEVYDRETDKKGMAELHIAKHRNGPIGVVPLRFDLATTRFDTLTYRTPEGY
jgi:replicative DNA helicase